MSSLRNWPKRWHTMTGYWPLRLLVKPAIPETHDRQRKNGGPPHRSPPQVKRRNGFHCAQLFHLERSGN